MRIEVTNGLTEEQHRECCRWADLALSTYEAAYLGAELDWHERLEFWNDSYDSHAFMQWRMMQGEDGRFREEGT